MLERPRKVLQNFFYIVTCQKKTELLHPIKMQSNKSNTRGQQRACEYCKTAAGVQRFKGLTLDG